MHRSYASVRCSVYVSVGLMLVYVWSSLPDHTFSLRDSLPQLFGVNPRAFFLMGILALSIGLVASSKLLKEKTSPFEVLMPVVGSVGTACIAIAPFQMLFSAGALCAIGLVALGFSYCWFIVRFGLLFLGDRSVARIAYCIAGALIMEPLVRVGLESNFDHSVLAGVAVALPLVSAGLLFAARCLVGAQQAPNCRADGVGASSASGPNAAAAAADAGRVTGVVGTADAISAPSKASAEGPVADFGASGASLSVRELCFPGSANRGVAQTAADAACRKAARGRLILLFTTAFLLATVRTLSPVGTWDSPFDPTPMTSSVWLVALYAVCVALFARFAVADTEGASALKRFQPAFLLVVLTELTSIVLLYTQGPQSAILYTSMCLNDSFAHILSWATVFCVAKSVAIPPFRLAGLALAAYAASSIAWLVLIGESEMLETVASVAAITILYILTIVTVKTGEGPAPAVLEAPVERVIGEGAPGAAAQPALTDRLGESVEERCLEIAREKGLSPRETDVMVLLAQGRTRLYIQEELFIAENTVKTHIAHIYKKLGVGNRQELLDMVYQKDETV